MNDLSTSGDQNLHFAAKFDIACASLSRKSHKRWVDLCFVGDADSGCAMVVQFGKKRTQTIE